MVAYLKSKILSSFKSKKINVFLLFLLFSFIVLVFLKLSSVYTKTIRFQVNRLNVPENHVILNNNNQVLNLSVRTSGFNLLKYYYKNPQIDIDFKRNLFIKDSTYYWIQSKGFSAINDQFAKDVEIISMTPDTLKFRFDVNAVKKVPIQSEVHLNFQPGYDLLEDISIEPDSIKIIGPEMLVSKIKSIKTDSLVINNIQADINQEVTLILPDNKEENLVFSHSKVLVKGRVEKFTEGQLKLPVNVINVPQDINLKYFPRKISVTYSSSLSNFNSIKAGDFKVVCDFAKVVEGTNYLVPEIVQKSDHARHVKMSKQPIEFIILK